MNKNLLKSKMALNNDNNKTLAEKIGITPSAFSYKLNNKNKFTTSHIECIALIRRVERL